MGSDNEYHMPTFTADEVKKMLAEIAPELGEVCYESDGQVWFDEPNDIKYRPIVYKAARLLCQMRGVPIPCYDCWDKGVWFEQPSCEHVEAA